MSAIDKDAQLFRKMLVWAAEQEERASQSYGAELLDLRETLTTYHYRRLQETEVRRIALHQGKSKFTLSADSGFIYLAAPESGRTLPVLNAKWNFAEDHSKLQLRLGLFHLGDNNTRIASGFRFEMPDKNEMHRYCHAQPITGLEIDRTMPWLTADLPTDGPTFPLDAQGFAQLLLTLLVSLYGAGVLRPAVAAITGLSTSCRKLHFFGGLDSAN